MGIYQKYIENDLHGNPVLDKNGKPKKTGPWFIQYPFTRELRTGKVKYRTMKASFSRKKAMEMLAEKEARFQRIEKYGEQPDTQMTVSELIDWGLTQPVMASKASAHDDKARGKFLKEAFGNTKAVKVTPLMVMNFRIQMKEMKSERTKRPYSNAMVNKTVALGRRIFYLAMEADLVKRNPFSRRGTLREEPKGKYIPDEKFREILKHLRDYVRPVVLTAYLTGMRRGEIFGLKWDRVDLFNGTIDLTAEDTKTAEPRTIYFGAIKELKEVLLKRAKGRSPRQKLVFCKKDGSKLPMTYCYKLFQQACKKASVGPYRFHDLRHTFNTNMVKSGVEQIVVMKLTGHKTNSMFSRYSHLDRELGEKAMEKLEGFLENGKKITPKATPIDLPKTRDHLSLVKDG